MHISIAVAKPGFLRVLSTGFFALFGSSMSAAHLMSSSFPPSLNDEERFSFSYSQS